MAHRVVVMGVTAAGGAGDGPVESHGARSYAQTTKTVKDVRLRIG
jgi:hypothetical protein